LLNPGWHQGLASAEAVAGQRGRNFRSEVHVVPGRRIGKLLARGQEALHVRRVATKHDGTVVENDGPPGLGSREGIAQCGVDPAAGERPPRDRLGRISVRSPWGQLLRKRMGMVCHKPLQHNCLCAYSGRFSSVPIPRQSKTRIPDQESGRKSPRPSGGPLDHKCPFRIGLPCGSNCHGLHACRESGSSAVSSVHGPAF
jgi:hypothetical protein